MSAAALILDQGAPVYDKSPWTRAGSLSVALHGALLLLLVFMTVSSRGPVQPVITEIKFVEKKNPVVVPVAAPPAAKPVVPGTVKGKVSEGTSPQSQFSKGPVTINSAGAAPIAAGVNVMPQGVASPKQVGAAIPLSGPIVTQQTLGWVGTKAAALRELDHRAGGNTGSGMGTEKENYGSLHEPVAMGREGLDEIRKKESSIGTPLVSQQIADGATTALGAKTKTLLGSDEAAAKRRAAVESLKANPLDQEKWGKQKGPFSIEGPLKYRKILKMELPPYPRWAEEKALEASVSIRLWVDPRGKVKDNFYMEKTSGYSELDQLAMDSLRKFVFVPLPSNLTQEDEWGVATFRFELKK